MKQLRVMMKLLLVVLIIIIITERYCHCEGCFEDERVALMELKPYFKYCNKFGSNSVIDSARCPWGIGDNCCEWEGVKCSSTSGRVTHLDLGGYAVTAWFSKELYLNVSLFLPFQQLQSLNLQQNFIIGCLHNQGFDVLSRLEKLESLDLSWNGFEDKSILSSIGRISSLKSLSLNNTGLNSTTDIQGLLRLENLEHLDLSDNRFNSSIFSFLSGLSSLKSLGLENQAFVNTTGDYIIKMEGSSSSMIKLNGPNWSIWKPMMEDILYCKDMHEAIEGESVKPKDMTVPDWNKLNRKAIGTIRQWLDFNVFHHVSEETSAHELWKKLEELYDRKTAGNKLFLIRKLVVR